MLPETYPDTELDLFVGLLHAPLVALGPGSRVGLWLTGCQRACPGCLAPEFWARDPARREPVAQVAARIIQAAQAIDTRAVTISGGEPLASPLALRSLLESLRQGGLEDILIYSGLTAPALLAAYPWVQSLSAALVAGPFDQNRPAREIYRGSANQELTLFDQALAPLYQTWAKQTQRQAQTLVAAGRLWLLGIPGLGDYERLVATTARLAAP